MMGFDEPIDDADEVRRVPPCPSRLAIVGLSCLASTHHLFKRIGLLYWSVGLSLMLTAAATRAVLSMCSRVSCTRTTSLSHHLA